jgi:hypothetical protein
VLGLVVTVLVRLFDLTVDLGCSIILFVTPLLCRLWVVLLALASGPNAPLVAREQLSDHWELGFCVDDPELGLVDGSKDAANLRLFDALLQENVLQNEPSVIVQFPWLGAAAILIPVEV